MPSKLVLVLFSAALLGALAFFAWTNPSYQKAFEAKWYYMTGEYDRAYRLASEAYDLDRYNRMALTIMRQTEVARRYLAYIREGREYLARIEAIAAKEPIDDRDKIRIRLMCEIMLDRYTFLSPTPLTDRDLIEEAAKIYGRFKTLYASLFAHEAPLKQK